MIADPTPSDRPLQIRPHTPQFILSASASSFTTAWQLVLFIPQSSSFKFDHVRRLKQVYLCTDFFVRRFFLCPYH